ncbi:DUF3253 domain-containing protein [Pedobacter sp. GR22-6]|uniref:DUF3253 domain-containing protein n=1 Tax=Pedobacter sp. GR22-6 TaxID=3127957 RepID=UPI00307F1F18
MKKAMSWILKTSNKNAIVDRNAKIAAKLLAVAEERGTEKTTCPSEIARMLFPEDWRMHMDEVVDVAIKLHHQHQVVITQKGKTIDVGHIKGPIRIKTV